VFLWQLLNRLEEPDLLMLPVLAKHLNFLSLKATLAHHPIVAVRDISREFPLPLFSGEPYKYGITLREERY
jgi:hypothetical protein